MAVCCYWYWPSIHLALHVRLLTVHEDIDDKNLHYARENIVKNNFQSRIRPLKTKPDGSLMPLAELGLDRYHLPHGENHLKH